MNERPDFIDVHPNETAAEVVAVLILLSMKDDGRSVVVPLSTLQKIQRALDDCP